MADENHEGSADDTSVYTAGRFFVLGFGVFLWLQFPFHYLARVVREQSGPGAEPTTLPVVPGTTVVSIPAGFAALAVGFGIAHGLLARGYDVAADVWWGLLGTLGCLIVLRLVAGMLGVTIRSGELLWVVAVPVAVVASVAVRRRD